MSSPVPQAPKSWNVQHVSLGQAWTSDLLPLLSSVKWVSSQHFLLYVVCSRMN